MENKTITIGENGMVYYGGVPQPLWVFRGARTGAPVVHVSFENGWTLSILAYEGGDYGEIMLFDDTSDGYHDIDPHFHFPLGNLDRVIEVLSTMPSYNHPDANWEEVWHNIHTS